MAAALSFYAGENFSIDNLAGSGLGFYGGTFGTSVAVGAYQSATYITNGAGTSQGPQVDNIKYVNIGSGEVNGAGSGIALTAIPNYQATLNVRFTNDTAVQTQNAKIYIYDRSDKNNNPSGVTCQVAELVHPWLTNSPGGSGDTVWTQCFGSGSTLSLVDSPGTSGLSPNGPSTSDVQHDFYCAISASPDSIGSKTLFGLYVSLEYF